MMRFLKTRLFRVVVTAAFVAGSYAAVAGALSLFAAW